MKKKSIKVNFCDMWRNFSPVQTYFYLLLKENYDIQISDNPDFLIYSCFGKENKKYGCTKIFITDENIVPDFNECDYAVSYNNIKFGDRHCRYSTYFSSNILTQDRENITKDFAKRRFCNFIYSNNWGGRRFNKTGVFS